MKILLITDGITPFVLGGMQKHSANLAKYLTLAGVEVTLVHCVGHSDKIPTKEEVDEVLFSGENSLHNIIGLQFPKGEKLPGHYLKESYRYSEMVYDELKDSLNEYDFIYAKGFSAWKLLAEKAKGKKMPPVGVKFHGYEMFQQPPSFRSRIERWFLRKPTRWNTINADYVFSYGAKITDLIKELGVPDNKIISVPSGIDDEWIRSDEIKMNPPVKLVYLGRYERRKGIEELMRVISSLPNDLLYEFHFIGPIPENKRLKKATLHYHGAIQDKKQLTSILDSCDVLVCPSHSEGMPNVILEGMSRGLAIIATDVGAVRLLVSESVGILLDSVNEAKLKDAILHMITIESEQLIKLKRTSLQIVNEGFRWNVVIQELIKKLDEIIAEK